jgi:pimeloyl-ACP methyl ester carboxylesterase
MLDNFIHKILRIPYRLYIASDRRMQDEKITLIFWHGIGSSSATWTKAIAAMSDNPAFDQARLVAMDLFGFGKSPTPSWSDYTIDDNLKSLRRTLRSLHIKTPIILVGHSMGCLLAVEYATIYPKNIKALALVSPPFLQPAEAKIIFDRFYRKIYSKVLTAAQNKQLDQAASFFEKFTSFEADSVGRESLERAMKNVILGNRTFDRVQKLTLPIYMFHGAVDILVNGANLKILARRPNIFLNTTPVGHDLVRPKRDQLIKVLTELVSKN